MVGSTTGVMAARATVAVLSGGSEGGNGGGSVGSIDLERERERSRRGVFLEREMGFFQRERERGVLRWDCQIVNGELGKEGENGERWCPLLVNADDWI